MKLNELAEVIANGDTATTLLEALGQRMVRVPEGWDWENLAGVCECGCLLAPLPRTIRQDRVVVMPSRVQPDGLGGMYLAPSQAVRVAYDMTHAHLAAPDGRPVCAECMDEEPGAVCENGPHEAEMCDTPTPIACSECTEAALPDRDYCLECRPYEPDWDKDQYLGL